MDENKIFCTNCGCPIEDQSTGVCPNCGTPILPPQDNNGNFDNTYNGYDNQNMYYDMPTNNPQPKKSNALAIIIAIVVILCGGCFGAMYTGVIDGAKFGIVNQQKALEKIDKYIKNSEYEKACNYALVVQRAKPKNRELLEKLVVTINPVNSFKAYKMVENYANKVGEKNLDDTVKKWIEIGKTPVEIPYIEPNGGTYVYPPNVQMEFDATILGRGIFYTTDGSEPTEESNLYYNGVKIAVGMGTNTDLLLVYLESVDGTGESGFYVYDSVNQSFSKYIEVSQPELSYCILPIDAASMELPDGYELGKIDIDGREVEVLLDKTGNYVLFYGVSSTGGTGWFRYNTNDGTIQGYAGYNTADEPVFNIIDRKNNSSTGSFSLFKGINLIFMIIIAALAIVIIILAVMVEMLSRKLKVSKKAFVKAMDDYDDSDEYDELINIKDGSSRTLHAGDVKDSYNSEDDSTDYAEDNNADYEDNSYSADENDLSDKNYDADAEDILNNSGISDTEDTSSENVSEEIELEEIELEDKKR